MIVIKAANDQLRLIFFDNIFVKRLDIEYFICMFAKIFRKNYFLNGEF